MKACKKDTDCPTPFTCRRSDRCEQAPGELAPFKIAGPLPVVGSGGMVGGPSDTSRLDQLEELLYYCPHAELTYNDDQDEGLVGYGINVDGEEPISIFNSTLRGALDQLREVLASRND